MRCGDVARYVCTRECIRDLAPTNDSGGRITRYRNSRRGGAMAEPRTKNDQRPDPNEKLVRIFDTEQESEAMVVRGLLEFAGIDVDMTSLDAQQDILPGVGGTVILVREEDAD